MSKTYFLRDTALVNGIHVADFESELALAAGAGETQGQTLGGGESRLTHVHVTPTDEPNSAAWPTGDYTGQLDVDTAGANITYGYRTAGAVTGHIARVNAGITSDLETKAQTEALFSLTGLKTFSTGSVSWTAGAATDRFELLLAATRAANHGNQTLSLAYDTDASVTGPWVAATTQVQKTVDFDLKVLSTLSKTLDYDLLALLQGQKTLDFDLKVLSILSKTLDIDLKALSTLIKTVDFDLLALMQDQKTIDYDLKAQATLFKTVDFDVNVLAPALSKTINYDLLALLQGQKTLDFDLKVSAPGLFKTINFDMIVSDGVAGPTTYNWAADFDPFLIMGDC